MLVEVIVGVGVLVEVIVGVGVGEGQLPATVKVVPAPE